MTAAPFLIREYVRWGDVDAAGIIRYDAYTRFMELAEAEMFRSVGISHRDFLTRFDFTIPRRAMHIDFESPPTLDEQLTVVTYIPKVGTTSMTLAFDFAGTGGRLRAAGSLVLVCATAGHVAARPWPPEFLGLLAPYRVSSEVARQVAGVESR
jgi:YbgC/YbaW family acyl-CoA thioester hydrolase